MEHTIRERTEALERQTLSPRACLSVNSKGRPTKIPPCPMRTCFQRDVDRVVHCKSFRRLKHKTQVFLQPEGDHYRTRMTHTLEVSRIARTMARGLSMIFSSSCFFIVLCFSKYRLSGLSRRLGALWAFPMPFFSHPVAPHYDGYW